MVHSSTALALLISWISNIKHTLSEAVDCRNGDCQCTQPGHCEIYCDTYPDQCKESLLTCFPGYPCTIYCAGSNACVNAQISGYIASDVTLVCSGNDACKGSDGLIDCGYGDCRVDCHGPTDCEDLRITAGAARSFVCYGFCPENRPRDYTNSPTKSPTKSPTDPSRSPSTSPSRSPTHFPTKAPVTQSPTRSPSDSPSAAPSDSPSAAPSGAPTQPPSQAPSFSPSAAPSPSPTRGPSPAPTGFPSRSPTPAPTIGPTRFPSRNPSQSPTPQPTGFPTGSPKLPSTQTLICSGSYQLCRCNQLQPCVIDCQGKDSCVDSTLICPMKHDCVINCPDHACKKAEVQGPRGADFTMICDGDSSCIDAKVQSERANDVAFFCGGKDSCKGSGTKINCGTGICTLSFLGEASGDASTINTNGALGFQCDGRYAPCPDNYVPPCDAAERAACVAPKFFDEMSCQCRCPENPDGIRVCAGQFEVFSLDTCDCQLRCPGYAPTPEECAMFQLDWEGCTCRERPPPTPVPTLPPVRTPVPTMPARESPNLCCLSNPAQPDPVMWAGTCWPQRSEAECEAVPNYRCLWNPYQCLPNPPVNSLNPYSPCRFAGQRCLSFVDCCSEYCHSDGFCR